MIAFPHMLVSAAAKAGMATPDDPENYDQDKFPHWFVYSKMQLGVSMPHSGCHWDNAEVVAEIADAEIRSVTPQMLIDRGFAVGFPIP